MFRNNGVISFNRLSDFNTITALSYTTNTTLADNEWTFNADKELHIKDASTSIFGAFFKDIYGLAVGDIIEVSCEVFPISGTLPKIAIDGKGSATVPLLNTEGYSYTSSQWKSFNVKYIIQSQHTFYRIMLGTLTTDIGEFKIRNLKIAICSDQNVDISNSIVFPYSTGFTDVSTTYASFIRKNNNGEVTISFNGKYTTGADFATGSGIQLGSLPEGYRPLQAIRFPISGDMTDPPKCGYGICWITTSGAITIYAGTPIKNAGFIVKFPTI